MIWFVAPSSNWFLGFVTIPPAPLIFQPGRRRLGLGIGLGPLRIPPHP